MGDTCQIHGWLRGSVMKNNREMAVEVLVITFVILAIITAIMHPQVLVYLAKHSILAHPNLTSTILH